MAQAQRARAAAHEALLDSLSVVMAHRDPPRAVGAGETLKQLSIGGAKHDKNKNLLMNRNNHTNYMRPTVITDRKT